MGTSDQAEIKRDDNGMNNDQLLEITTEIGWRLLQSGAEIYRVEESIKRMLAAYGFAEVDVFSIPSCIIVTVNDENGHALTRIKRNRSSSLDFDRIDKLNNLCRHVCTERPPLEQIRASLDAIMGKKDYSFWTRLFFTASISASFTLFYGGNFQDSFASFFIGILLFLLLSLLGNFGTNSFFQNIFGSALVAGLSVWTTAMGWTVNYDKMIIGTLMNLVPGIAITNVMRDILGGDLIAGIIKLVESLMVAVGIALGAGLAISTLRYFSGEFKGGAWRYDGKYPRLFLYLSGLLLFLLYF